MLTNQVLNSAPASPESVNHSLTLYPAGSAKLHRDPVVLIHGWGSNSEIWQTLPDKLSDYIDVYTLDLPGFGNSQLIDDYS
jgi:pimeloyl-ACP methyl ester carboxylesterase